MVDEVVEFCAGLDVHRDTVVATVRFPRGRQRGSETKTFGIDTAELVALSDWLISHQVIDRVDVQASWVGHDTSLPLVRRVRRTP